MLNNLDTCLDVHIYIFLFNLKFFYVCILFKTGLINTNF